MQPDYQDKRRFQIAVIGSPTSDRLIYLPPEHRDFDKVKRILNGRRCYCGRLLGGCGGELVPTKGTGRVCFLRHLPGSGCRLDKLREDAADHILIGRDLRGLLMFHGAKAEKPRYEFPELDVGQAVVVEADRSRLIYSHLSNESVRRWETTRELRGFRNSRVSVLYGEAVRPDFIDLRDKRYTLRVRCQTRGADRKMFIGTQVSYSKIWWAPIRDCRFEGGEILTPYLELHDGTLVPTKYALDGKPTRLDNATKPSGPDLDPSLIPLRRRYELACKLDDKLELLIVREEIKEARDRNPLLLGSETLWSSVQKTFRQVVPTSGWVSSFWKRVAEYVQHRRQLQREELLKIYRHAESLSNGDQGSRRALEWMRGDLGIERLGPPASLAGSKFTEAEFESIAKDTWAILKEAAAEGRSTTWTTLNKHLNGRYNGIAPSHIVDVFLHIQRELAGTSDPVSALVTTSKGNRHPDLYDGVLERLGTKPETVEQIEARWRRDRQRLFRTFGE